MSPLLAGPGERGLDALGIPPLHCGPMLAGVLLIVVLPPPPTEPPPHGVDVPEPLELLLGVVPL